MTLKHDSPIRVSRICNFNFNINIFFNFNGNFNFSCNYESATGLLVVKHSYGVAETLWVAQVSFGCARGPYGWYEGFPWIVYRIPMEVEYLLGNKGLYRIVQESCIWHI